MEPEGQGKALWMSTLWNGPLRCSVANRSLFSEEEKQCVFTIFFFLLKHFIICFVLYLKYSAISCSFKIRFVKILPNRAFETYSLYLYFYFTVSCPCKSFLIDQ